MLTFEIGSMLTLNSTYLTQAILLILWIPTRIFVYTKTATSNNPTDQRDRRQSDNLHKLKLTFWLSILSLLVGSVCMLISDVLWTNLSTNPSSAGLLLINNKQLALADNSSTTVNGVKLLTSEPQQIATLSIVSLISVGLHLSAVYFALAWLLKHPVWLYRSGGAVGSGKQPALIQIDGPNKKAGKTAASNLLALWGGLSWACLLMVPTLMGLRMLSTLTGQGTSEILLKTAIIQTAYSVQLIFIGAGALLMRQMLHNRWPNCWRISKWLYLTAALSLLDSVACLALAVFNFQQSSEAKLQITASDSRPMYAMGMLMELHNLSAFLMAFVTLELAFAAVPPQQRGKKSNDGDSKVTEKKTIKATVAPGGQLPKPPHRPIKTPFSRKSVVSSINTPPSINTNVVNKQHPVVTAGAIVPKTDSISSQPPAPPPKTPLPAPRHTSPTSPTHPTSLGSSMKPSNTRPSVIPSTIMPLDITPESARASRMPETNTHTLQSAPLPQQRHQQQPQQQIINRPNRQVSAVVTSSPLKQSVNTSTTTAAANNGNKFHHSMPPANDYDDDDDDFDYEEEEEEDDYDVFDD